MIGKLLLTFMMISQLTSPSYSSNVKLLDSEVDMWASRVWTGHFILEDEIKNSLTFLNKIYNTDNKYLDSSSFNSFYKQAVKDVQEIDQVTGGHFPKFASLCKALYEKENDDKNKVGFYMLFEGVTKKHLEQVRKAKSLMSKKSDSAFSSSNNFSDSLDLFKRFFDGSPDSSTKVQ